jgi:hypothetical protein
VQIKVTTTTDAATVTGMTYRVGHIIDGLDEDEIPGPTAVRALVEIATTEGPVVVAMTDLQCEHARQMFHDLEQSVAAAKADLA